jgi:hypothetical protein
MIKTSSMNQKLSSRDRHSILDTYFNMATESKIVWIPVAPGDELPRGIVFCSNNITATDNKGAMTHVWSARLFLSRRDGEIKGMEEPTDHFSKSFIRGVTHYSPITSLPQTALRFPVHFYMAGNLYLHGTEAAGYWSAYKKE